ncbi:DUF4097 family beta strand repeat-containing protein [Brachybacterium sacelli]|uniref:DUF4097 domain-containing protein n=1 Tax=Brachybacterium sacelli TaxID=173364 RepID=A0ABS4WY14_9MICO|nr:DUF4097 family beta strand repeat-containing protein [Brachybacterium sacelli]MBP2381100.1 hypothetical protein [Brachybacterium sacelli]
MTMPQQSAPVPPPAPGPPENSATRSHEFTATGPIDVSVQNVRGAVVLRAEHGTDVRVELFAHGEAARELAERMTISFEHDRLVVDAPSDEFGRVGGDLGDFFRSFGNRDGTPLSDRLADGVRSLVRGAEGLTGALDVTVVVPGGSRAVLVDGAGEISVHGALAVLEARTGAGELTIDQGAQERSRLTTGTGDIQVGSAHGDFVARTGTGGIQVGRAAGFLAATTGTGNVDLREIAGEVSVTTGVGDITVQRATSGHFAARSGLGDVTIHVTPGTATRLELATGFGDRDVQLTPTEGAGEAERTLEIEARTGKGDLRVLRAEA